MDPDLTLLNMHNTGTCQTKIILYFIIFRSGTGALTIQNAGEFACLISVSGSGFVFYFKDWTHGVEYYLYLP
jgi:hypothetical protein